MEKANDIELTCLLEQLRSKGQHKAAFWHRSEIAEAVETVVDIVDPRIRVLSRYNKRLRNAVDTAWRYLDNLTQNIPCELHLSKNSFAIDPRVRVLFAHLDSMLRLFDQSQSLKEFFVAHPHADIAYLFLCMDMKEKTRFGVELDGEMLKREVMQTAVTFTDHAILSPALIQQDAAQGVKCLGFSLLLKKVNQAISQSGIENRSLQDRKRQLTEEIRSLKIAANTAGTDNPLATASMEKLQHELHDVEHYLAITRMEAESPDHHMQCIVDILQEPQKYLTIQRQSVSINNLGIKSEQGNTIEYAELEIPQLAKRVVMIVTVPKEDVAD